MMNRRAFFPLLAGAALPRAACGRVKWLRSPWLQSQEYLLSRQSQDGAWRSTVYGAFKDGRGLTPLVLRSLVGSRRPEVRAACGRALDWVRNELSQGVEVFPVHHASWLLQIADYDSRLAKVQAVLRDQLVDLQLGSSLGWKREDMCFGGWSYASRAAHKQEGQALAAMQQPNLSATVLAVCGLRGESPARFIEAAEFIGLCQNFSDAGCAFDDGGFFQMPEDPTRNKAGVAGKDESGRRRFRSYASATADGLRGLLLTGATPEEARVQAAARWLEERMWDDVPDLTFYTCYAGASAFRLLERAESTTRRWRERLSQLETFRRADGSYCNPSGEMRENDPVVATSLALMAGRLTGVA